MKEGDGKKNLGWVKERANEKEKESGSNEHRGVDEALMNGADQDPAAGVLQSRMLTPILIVTQDGSRASTALKVSLRLRSRSHHPPSLGEDPQGHPARCLAHRTAH